MMDTFLKELRTESDKIHTSDDLIPNNTSLFVEIRRNHGRVESWTLRDNSAEAKTPKIMGKKWSELQAALLHGDEDVTDMNMSVLVLKDVSKKKTFEGKYHTAWFFIPSFAPYEEDDGKVVILTKEFDLTPEEYAVATETNVAFYNELENYFYPIQRSAISTINKYLDSAVAFKSADEFLLGAGILLAEKIGKKPVKMVYRDEGWFRPLLSVAGKNYEVASLYDFFKEALYYKVSEGFYTLHSWSIMSDRVTVDLCDRGNHILVTKSSVPGVPTQAVAYKCYGKTRIILKRNVVRRSKVRAFIDFDLLFDGMEEAFIAYDTALESIKSTDSSVYTQAYLHRLEKIIGKKRIEKAREEIPKSMKSKDFFQYLVNYCNSSRMATAYEDKKSIYLWKSLNSLVRGEDVC